MAGTCLLAPASAAALMPAAIATAVMSSPAAVGSTAAGVFLSSLLQSHTQVFSPFLCAPCEIYFSEYGVDVGGRRREAL